MGSQAPAKDQTTTRTPYMPLFSEKVNLCKPKVNSIKCEANNLSTEQRKTFRYKGETESLPDTVTSFEYGKRKPVS